MTPKSLILHLKKIGVCFYPFSLILGKHCITRYTKSRCCAELSIDIVLLHGLYFQLQQEMYIYPATFNEIIVLFCNQPLPSALCSPIVSIFGEDQMRINFLVRTHISNNVRGSAWARNIQRRWSKRNSNQLHRASKSHWPISGIICQKAITDTRHFRVECCRN